MKAMGVKQELLSKDPYTISLIGKTKNPFIIQGSVHEIKKALKVNGADEKDYSVDVVEEL